MRRTDAAESGRDYRLGYTIGSREAGNVQLSVGVDAYPCGRTDAADTADRGMSAQAAISW